MASVQDIYNEIDRIEGAKGEIAEAIEEKGVAVPEEAKIEEYPGYVRQIQTGSPDAVLYTPQELTPEQQGQARENIGAGTYTKPNTGIPETDLAQGVQESLAKAESAYQKPNGGIPKTDLATAVQNSLGKADTALQPAALTPITDLIPEQATPQNKLADKNFVNSSVATNTANYISDNGQPFQSLADLEAYSGALTNNDYAFVVGTDAAGNTTYTRYKYNATTGEWAEEYVLNNSSFTAEQWAAISSGITALLVQKLTDLPTEIVTYVTQTLTDAQKQQARTNIGATAPEIFWATYDVTTAQDIRNAIATDKICLLVYNGRTYYFSGDLVGSASYNFLWFMCMQNDQTWYARVRTDTNQWSSNYANLERATNKSQSVPADRASTTKYPSVKAVFDSLGKWGVISQTQTWTGSNATGYDYTMSDPVWGLIPQANIDLYTAAGAVFNENTGYFELNDLTDISYNEMKIIYAETYARRLPNGLVYAFSNKDIRTNFVVFRSAYALSAYGNVATGDIYCGGMAEYCQNLSSFYMWENDLANNIAKFLPIKNFYRSFYGCTKLKRIVGALCFTYLSSDQTLTFVACYSLQKVYIYGLKRNLPFNDSPRLNLESIVYAVNNSANTTAITITLHATAFARCQADTTEYTYGGNTYTGVIAYAAAKNITIASA